MNFLYKFLDKKYPNIDKVDYGGFIDFEDQTTKVLVRYTKGVYNRLAFNLDFVDEIVDLFGIDEYEAKIGILQWLQDEKNLEFPGGYRGEKFMV